MGIPAMSATPPISLIKTKALEMEVGRSHEEVAKSFESVFASLLIKEMRNTLSDGLFGSEGSDVFGSLFDLHMGEAITNGRGLGVKEMILAQLDRQGGGK